MLENTYKLRILKDPFGNKVKKFQFIIFNPNTKPENSENKDILEIMDLFSMPNLGFKYIEKEFKTILFPDKIVGEMEKFLSPMIQVRVDFISTEEMLIKFYVISNDKDETAETLMEKIKIPEIIEIKKYENYNNQLN